MKRIITKFWPILLIFFTWFFFAKPYILENKVPFPSTYQVNNFAPWSTNEKFWGPVKNGAMPDIITQIYPWKYFTIQTYKLGQIPLWNPYSFSGTPHLANYQSAVFSPFNLLFFIFSFVDAWTVLIILQPLLTGLFMFPLLRSLNVSKLGSLISSISFMFSGFITVWMGYGTLGYAILFLPLSLFSIEKYYNSKKIRYALLLTATIPLIIFSGHFQIGFYSMLFLVLYLLYKMFSTRNYKLFLNLLIFIFCGLLISSIQLLPSIELYLQSVRSFLFQKSEAIPIQYFPTLIAPDFFGNPVTRNDWFGHYAEWNGYIGFLPFMLVFYLLLRIRKGLILFLFSVAFAALLLAFDTPFLSILISFHLPVLSTSAASRIIVIYSLVFCILSGFALDQLIKDIKTGRKKEIIVTIGAFIFLFIGLWLTVLSTNFLEIDKARIARSNLVLPSIIFLSSSCFIFISFVLKNKKYKSIFPYFLLFILIFDMLRFTTKWQPFDPKDLVFPQIQVVNLFKTISGYERVFGNLGGEATIYYSLPSVEGYDPLYIRRYGEFISSINDGKVSDLGRSVVLFPKHGLYTPESIDLLNIKYVIHKIGDGHVDWTFPFWTYPNGQFNLLYKDNKYEVFDNTQAYPHVFLAGKYKVISKSQEIINAMFNKRTNLKKEVILEQNPGFLKTNDNIGDVKILRYTPNSIEMTAKLKSKGILVLLDNYYPGWKAKVDEKETSIYRSDYTFRSIVVDKGEHRISFDYEPLSFKLGLYFAVVGLFGLIFISLKLRIKP